MGLHPTVTTGLISGRACLGVPAIKSAALMSPPPPPLPWSRSLLLPITYAQLIISCPFNLCVGQSCLHFISPLISNYPHQYPKSHNLGFHQHPLHDTKIKPSQLALNSSPPYNQIILSAQSKHHVHNWKQNTHFQIIHSFHHQKYIHTSFIIFCSPNNTITLTKPILPR